MTIGKLARATEENVQTLRFYERAGLLEEPQRTASRYRIYSNDAVDRIRFIRNAQHIGYSLEEIRELLNLRVSDSNPCHRVRELTYAKIAEIDEKIRLLQGLKKQLDRLVKLCAYGGPTGRCPILEAL